MPKLNEFTFPSCDGRTMIYVREFVPDGEIKGTVQIAHGVAEYNARYDEFMTFLAENGYVAAANDHLGHGRSICTEEDKGFFHDHDGWDKVVEDMRKLREIQKEKYPSVKTVLFGHSMGSFLSRTYIIKHPDDFDACVICGTGQQSPVIVNAGIALAKFKCKTKGTGYRSESMQKIAFGSYNNGFQPQRTDFDWLSANEENVDKYIADPLCGGISTVGLFRDMLGGISFISKKANINNMRKDLPVYFIAGALDPVGENGKGVARAYDSFVSVGMTDVSLKLYKDMRHEILNEDIKDRVFEDVLFWINEKIG